MLLSLPRRRRAPRDHRGPALGLSFPACHKSGCHSHGVRRLLAVERGHLDTDSGSWRTRGWLS